MDAIEALPEFDKPSYFGLPENIERSSQKMISGGVITQLKILKRADTKAAKFDKDVWATELGPVLALWRKINQVIAVMLMWLFIQMITSKRGFHARHDFSLHDTLISSVVYFYLVGRQHHPVKDTGSERQERQRLPG